MSIGGKYSFLKFNNVSTANSGAAFYTNAAVINDFKAYITHILNHVNSYTSIAYKNEPTIAMWETGNELGAYQEKEGPPPAAWTSQITALIKQLAPYQLVIDGTDGVHSGSTVNPGASVSTVDVVSDHFYPVSSSIMATDLKYSKAKSKVRFIHACSQYCEM